MAWWPRKDADQEEDNTKYMLFSATFTKAAHGLATTQLADHHLVFDLLNTVPPGRTIVSINNKHAADELDDFLFNKRIPGTYSVFTVTRRRTALAGFPWNGLVGSRVVLVELKQKFRLNNNGEVRGRSSLGAKIGQHHG
ncbi:hypothetical protein B0T13DRAFT_491895 [Neurospora crassa]|nr:hypothetical protein B0T13DRAFT_491895 [Neurospora crassa]